MFWSSTQWRWTRYNSLFFFYLFNRINQINPIPCVSLYVGVDCGGSCSPCPTCTDNTLNGDEQGMCIGRVFRCLLYCLNDWYACRVSSTDLVCVYVWIGVDCGGSCTACPTCADHTRNGDETGHKLNRTLQATHIVQLCRLIKFACLTELCVIVCWWCVGVDCGGSCAACPTCTDGSRNGDETGIKALLTCVEID